MKKIIIIAIVLFVASCGSTSDNETKKAELTKLKTELNNIQNKIAALDKELANDQDNENIQSYKTPVSVKEVNKEVFNHFIEVSGNIEAVNTAFISPEMAGQIKKVYVKEGERVSKGQKLAKLNTATIEKNINELKTGLEYATIIYTKQKNLWDQKIGSEIDYLTAKNTKDGLEDKLETLKVQLELALIKAPFGGIIDDIIQKEGELASPGMQMMQLVNLNKLYINADVAETYLPVIHKGDKVELSFPTFPDLAMTIPVYRIANTIHPLNRTVIMQLQINNKNELLKPNGLALIRINDFSAKDALVVPSIIIKQDMTGSFLYVVKLVNKEWIAKKQYIKIGVSFEDQTLVTEGLSVGEKVVVEGYNQISDGSEIEIK